jgi:four helix bundle protein
MNGKQNGIYKLDAYRCALELHRAIMTMTENFPRGEADLKSQMRRSSRSIPFNIGEGVGKQGAARAAAYEIALGEDKELLVALDCVAIGQLAPAQEILPAQELADRMAAMLTKMIRRARKGPEKEPEARDNNLGHRDRGS